MQIFALIQGRGGLPDLVSHPLLVVIDIFFCKYEVWYGVSHSTVNSGQFWPPHISLSAAMVNLPISHTLSGFTNICIYYYKAVFCLEKISPNWLLWQTDTFWCISWNFSRILGIFCWFNMTISSHSNNWGFPLKSFFKLHLIRVGRDQNMNQTGVYLWP